MSDGIMLMLNNNGVATAYDDTFDITIHCENEEEQKKAWELIQARNWIPISDRLPPVDEDGFSDKILVSFSNCSLPEIGEYRLNDVKGEGFYAGDLTETFAEYGLKVNAWMPLPKSYKGDDSDDQQRSTDDPAEGSGVQEN